MKNSYNPWFFQPLQGLVWALSIGRNSSSYQIYRELKSLDIRSPFPKRNSNPFSKQGHPKNLKHFTERSVNNVVASLKKQGILKQSHDKKFTADISEIVKEVELRHPLIDRSKLESWIVKYRRFLYFVSLKYFQQMYFEMPYLFPFLIRESDMNKWNKRPGFQLAYLLAREISLIFDELFAELRLSEFEKLHNGIINFKVSRNHPQSDMKFPLSNFINVYYKGKGKEMSDDIKEFRSTVVPYLENLKFEELKKLSININQIKIDECHDLVVEKTLELFNKKGINALESYDEIESNSKKHLENSLNKIEKIISNYLERTPKLILKELEHKKRVS